MSRGKVIYAADFGKRPAWFRAINAVWERTYGLGTRPVLARDELIRTARRKTGLDDLGADFTEEPLDKLLYSLNNEARLTPLGRFISRERIINLLMVRLRAEYWFAKYPEILDRELLPPWVIIGLQRTGTTKLQRVLTADPDNRVLRSWEAINPAPIGRPRERKKRIRIARNSERALRIMAPGFFAIHPVEHLAPEEDILLLDTSFMSTTPEATTHVPSYAQWLEKTDQSLAYQYGSKLLRLLQWQRQGVRWVLKTPHHLEFLPLIERYYGKPMLIWTHRKLEECIPSFLSMVCHTRALFSDHVKPREVAGHWVYKTSYMLQKAIRYLQGAPHVECLHMDYNDLVVDTGKQLERIYDTSGGIPAGQSIRFERAEEQNPRGKYGLHMYDARDFGLSGEVLRAKNPIYTKFHALMMQQNKLQ